MFKAFEFCLPTTGTIVPAGPEWLHEIKYDGYRLRLERDGDRVRLITRGGYNWTDRYPWIVEAALKNRHRQFVIDESDRPGLFDFEFSLALEGQTVDPAEPEPIERQVRSPMVELVLAAVCLASACIFLAHAIEAYRAQ